MTKESADGHKWAYAKAVCGEVECDPKERPLHMPTGRRNGGLDGWFTEKEVDGVKKVAQNPCLDGNCRKGLRPELDAALKAGVRKAERGTTTAAANTTTGNMVDEVPVMAVCFQIRPRPSQHTTHLMHATR